MCKNMNEKCINTVGISPETNLSLEKAKAFFHSPEYVIFPGFCDVHVHFREPGFSYKETVRTGSMAAAKGGYTAVCTMPNLNPVPDSKENLGIQLDAIKKDEHMRLNLVEGIALAMSFKIGGELLRTVVVRDWDEILLLGAVILLRAALTFYIQWEIRIEKKKKEERRWKNKEKKKESREC